MNVPTEESAPRDAQIDLNRVDFTPETIISGRFWTLGRPKSMVAAATIVFRGGGNHENNGRRGDHCFAKGQRGDSATKRQRQDSAA